jgi:putative sigma-54 modulation protein
MLPLINYIKEFVMNTSIVGRHLDLTEPIKDYINSSIEIFKKYNLDIISVNAIIDQEEKHGKKAFSFEFTLNIAHLDTVVVKQKDKDLYSAIDIAVDRVSKVLRRHHDKISGHKATKLTEVALKEIEDEICNELDKLDNEIEPVRLTSYKPMDIEEALNDLKSSDAAFKVFYDKDDNMRVLYKRSEEGKFGLY